MFGQKTMALAAGIALAATLTIAGCGGAQTAASSAAASEATSAATSEATSAAPAATSSAATDATSAAPAATTSAAPATTTTVTEGFIGEEAAKDIALKDAGFAAADVTELKAELDTDDAVVHYDVDFKNGGKEYDYDIDATTGAIITVDSEIDD